MSRTVTLTGNERFFKSDEIIVSKTNLKGQITYCNDVFVRVAGYSENELLGKPHSIIRHPGMPRCVFQFMWDTLEKGQEIFAYVINRCKNGDHYWVNAHVTPSRDLSGRIVGYHSNRRVPEKAIVTQHIEPLYETLLAEEQRHANRKEGLRASTTLLLKTLEETGMAYDEFIATLKLNHSAAQTTAHSSAAKI